MSATPETPQKPGAASCTNVGVHAAMSITWLITMTKLLSQYPPFPTAGSPSCNPPLWASSIAGAGFSYYSPGICPSGFVVGPSCGVTETRTAEGFSVIARGETAGYCVPTSLTCTTDTSDWRGGVWGFARDGTTSGAIVTVGPALQIRWVAANLTILETHPLIPGLKLSASQMESITQTETTNSPVDTMTRIFTISNEAMGSYPTLILYRKTPTVFGGTNSGIVFETAYPTNNTSSRTSRLHKKEVKGLGSLNRGTGIAVIVIVIVIVGILLWTASFLAIRRYRRAKGKQNAHVADGDGYSSGAEQRFLKDENSGSSMTATAGSSASEGEERRADVGTAPNPAELEGDAGPPHWGWLSRKSWLRSSSANQSQDSHLSFYSTRFERRTFRESFGEKVNDPAAILGRLRIHNALSTVGKTSPISSSPRSGSFL